MCFVRHLWLIVVTPSEFDLSCFVTHVGILKSGFIDRPEAMVWIDPEFEAATIPEDEKYEGTEVDANVVTGYIPPSLPRPLSSDNSAFTSSLQAVQGIRPPMYANLRSLFSLPSSPPPVPP